MAPLAKRTWDIPASSFVATNTHGRLSPAAVAMRSSSRCAVRNECASLPSKTKAATSAAASVSATAGDSSRAAASPSSHSRMISSADPSADDVATSATG